MDQGPVSFVPLANPAGGHHSILEDNSYALVMLRSNKRMTANEFALYGLFDLEVSSMLVMRHAHCMPA